MFLVGLLISLLTIFVIAKHEEYRIKDDRTADEGTLDRLLKKRWHFYKGLYQGIIATLIGIAFGLDLSLFFATAFTIFHDAYINISVLGKHIDYVGETAWLDKTLKKLFKTNKGVFIFKLIGLAASIAYMILERV